MPNLTRAPRAALTKAKPRARRGSRRRRRRSGWWTSIKVAFLLERFRRRRSSPSLRQIALVVVSVGLAVMVIRAVSRRKSRRAGAQAETPVPAGEAASNSPTPDNDTSLADENSLTDRVQSEMSRRDDAPTPATGAG
jgi:hypothetical protein